jgi:GxxExxY protein
MNISQDNQLTGAVIGAAIEVHRQLGPALDEVAYEEALSLRLAKIGIENRRQVSLPLTYKGVRLDCGYRLDLLVESRLPVELKSVFEVLGVHEAQLLTYQRIGRYPLGLLMNFNVAVLKDGIRRKAESRFWTSPPEVNPAEIDPTKAFDPVSAAIVMAAVEVHRHIGPGLLDSSYLACLRHELAARKLTFETSVEISLTLDGVPLSAQAEVPLLVAKQVPVFPVSADSITKVHTAAAVSRLRQRGWKQGLVLNFNAPTMLAGIKRVVNS